MSGLGQSNHKVFYYIYIISLIGQTKIRRMI